MTETLESLDKKIRQARHNENRQRLRELLGQDVRVSSSFWEQVGREYRYQKVDLVENLMAKKMKSKGRKRKGGRGKTSKRKSGGGRKGWRY